MAKLEFHGVPSDVQEQVEETLASITAVKGEGYANLVRAMLSMNSLSAVMGQVVNTSHPLLPVALMMLTGMQGQVMGLLQEKLNVEATQKEIIDWADRINDNMQNTMKNCAKQGDDPLH